MALVFCDGFDHYGTWDHTTDLERIDDVPTPVGSARLSTDPAENQINYKWTLSGAQGGGLGIWQYTTVQRRPSLTGDPIGILVSQSIWYESWINRVFSEPHYNTLIVGFAFLAQPGYSGSANSPIVTFYDYDGKECARLWAIDSTGRVRMTAGDNESLQSFYSAINTTELYTWYHCEAKWVFDDVDGGSMECRINEVEVINHTGIQTYKTGGDSQGNFSFVKVMVGKGIHNAFFMDDFYVLDGEGVYSNDFLGDCRIDTLYPNGNGYYTNFTPYPEDNENWENVDVELFLRNAGYPFYEDQYYGFRIDWDTYNEAEATVRECYNLDSIVALDRPIYGIQTNSVVRKTDAGHKRIEQFVRTHGEDYNSPNPVDVGDFSRHYYYPVTVNPYTGEQWTESEINSLQSGIEIII